MSATKGWCAVMGFDDIKEKLSLYWLYWYAPDTYALISKLNAFIDSTCDKIRRRNLDYEQNFDWDALKKEFKYDLLNEFKSDDTRLQDWFINADEEALANLQRLCVEFYELLLIPAPNTALPTPTERNKPLLLNQIYQLIFLNDEDEDPTRSLHSSENISSVVHLIQTIEDLFPTQQATPGKLAWAKKWQKLLSLPPSLAQAMPMFPGLQQDDAPSPIPIGKKSYGLYRDGQGSVLIKRPIHHVDNAIEALASTIVNTIAPGLFVHCHLVRSDQGEICLASRMASGFKPLMQARNRFSSRLSLSEKKKLQTHLNSDERERVALILAYALLVGDYDCHVNNIGYSDDGIVKIDHQWGLDQVAKRPMVILNELSFFRHKDRLSPTNNVVDYRFLLESIEFKAAVEQLTAHFAKQQLALAQALEQQIVTMVELYKDEKTISDVDHKALCEAIMQRMFGASVRPQEENSQPLPSIILRALKFRLHELSIFAQSPRATKALRNYPSFGFHQAPANDSQAVPEPERTPRKVGFA